MSVAESPVDDRRRTSAWLLLLGIAFTLGAAATYSVLRAAFGDRPAHINVRWSPATTPDVQLRLEQQYHLTYGQRTEGRTFSYDLTDLSQNNIRAMVLDPSVEDTHYIHRTAYRIWRFAPRSKFKRLLRKRAARTVETLWSAIGDLLDHFSPLECSNYIRHSGYPAT